MNCVKPRYSVDRSEEFWMGWALAYYQWETALRFAEIVRCVPVKKVISLYYPYHEMDIQQYEQRQKNINKAQAEYLMMLSRALCCGVWDLMEKVEYPHHLDHPQ